MPLEDIIAPNLRVLFVGYNPSLKSAEVGHHFAGSTNGFWRILFDSGLTERRLAPEEDKLLLKMGMGSTNLVARPTRAAAELTREDYRQGTSELLQKLEYYHPQYVCYVGIGLYKIFAHCKQCPFGWQPHSVVSEVIDFVAPSTSGLNRMLYQDQLAIYRQLAERINR